MSRYFAIEGNIGAGKTSVLREISKLKPDWQIVNEPVSAFSHFQRYNPLCESYDDPEKNAAITQVHIIDSSLAHYRNFHGRTIVSERSVLSPKLFIKTNRNMGIFSDFVASFLQNYLHKNLTREHILPDVIYYLDVSPGTCFERTLQRGRIGENKMSRHFYDQFHSVAKNNQDYFLTYLSCSDSDTPLQIAQKLLEKIAEAEAEEETERKFQTT